MGSPSAFSRSGADQSNDSPTGWRTPSAGSMHVTLRPALARCKDAAFPARPPPITITSQSVEGILSDIGSVLRTVVQELPEGFIHSRFAEGLHGSPEASSISSLLVGDQGTLIEGPQNLLCLPEMAAFVGRENAKSAVDVVAYAGVHGGFYLHLIDGKSGCGTY